MSDIIVRACLKFIQIILKPVALFFFRTYYRKIDVPRPISKCHDLLLTPGHTLAEKIRNREVTSEKIVGLFIERIKQIQPILNCVVQERFDQAIEEARQVDQIMSNYLIDDKYSKSSAPLLGVPFSCKESIAAKGMPNSSGLVSRKNYTAQEDSAVVKYMQEAGAILICVTNTSECCMWIESSNYITGTTRNPYNPSRIVGGSSGGEACIISACGSVWGIGSDIGGSIRIPSLFNGIYGHKPTLDLVPNDFQFPSFTGIQNKMLSIGPMCRYASDLSHLFKIMCGP
ncbi:fatty-acid amide hydrolase 2, partial [Brachionus plicatilis]